MSTYGFSSIVTCIQMCWIVNVIIRARVGKHCCQEPPLYFLSVDCVCIMYSLLSSQMFHRAPMFIDFFSLICVGKFWMINSDQVLFSDKRVYKYLIKSDYS